MRLGLAVSRPRVTRVKTIRVPILEPFLAASDY